MMWKRRRVEGGGERESRQREEEKRGRQERKLISWPADNSFFFKAGAVCTWPRVGGGSVFLLGVHEPEGSAVHPIILLLHRCTTIIEK